MLLEGERAASLRIPRQGEALASPAVKRRTHRVEAGEAGRTLEQLVSERFGGEGLALIEAGAVYLKGKRVRDPAARVAAGDILTAVLEEGGRDVRAAEHASSAHSLTVLFEDASVIAVDKPAGLPAQPTPGGERSLVDLVRERLGHEPGLVHRLDRETTGVTVFGKTPEATSELAAAFRMGATRKQYLAVCGPALPEGGVIELPLSRDPSRPGRWRASLAANGIFAVTVYHRLALLEDHALVSLFPKTGRTHQLRAHLTGLQAPICGDTRYGGASEVAGEPAGRCLLHAYSLELPHPTRDDQLRLVAPLPEDLLRIFAKDDVAPPSPFVS